MTKTVSARNALANELVAFAKSHPMTKKAAAKHFPDAKPAKAAPAKTPTDPDAIKSCKESKLPETTLTVISAGGEKVVIDQDKVTAALQKLLVVGGSFKAVAAYLAKHGKAAPALARGVESRLNPHSSKAVADKRAASKPAKAATAAKAADKLPVKRGADYGYEVVNRDHGARPGSKRAIQLEIVFKHKTAAAAKAAGAEAVDLSFAIAQGFIRKI